MTEFFSRALSLRATVLALALGAVALVPSTASAAPAGNYTFSGSSAGASFSKADGCVSTNAYVSAIDGESKDNQSGQTSSSSVSLYVSQFNYCSYTGRSGYGYAELGPGDFDMPRSLGSASLKTTVNVYDYSTRQTLPVSVELTWTADGDATRSKSQYQTQYPDGTKLMYRSSGLFRPAVASGTISDGTVDYASGGQANWAQLSATKSGSLVITK